LGEDRGVAVVVVVDGVRVSARRIPTGRVCHPSGTWVKPSKSSLLPTSMALWEDHGIRIVGLLCWTRALVHRERVQLAAGAIGCQLRAGLVAW